MKNNRQVYANNNIVVEYINEYIISVNGNLAVAGYPILEKSDFTKTLNCMDIYENHSQHQI